MSAVSLRPMRWWDVEALVPLEAELFGATAWSAETFWSELAAPGSRYVVARTGERLVGYAGVRVLGAAADVQTVAVAPIGRGAGVGNLLLADLLAWAGGHGAHEVLLEVAADNVAAQRLYARHGFERTSVRRGYYAASDGQPPRDAWIMRLRPLPTPP